MQFNSVEDAVTHLEFQVFNLTNTCDKQSKKIENLELWKAWLYNKRLEFRIWITLMLSLYKVFLNKLFKN